MILRGIGKMAHCLHFCVNNSVLLLNNISFLHLLHPGVNRMLRTALELRIAYLEGRRESVK